MSEPLHINISDAADAVTPQNGKTQPRTATEDMLANINRQLPFSDEAERGLLSCLLQDPARYIAELRQDLKPEAFYHETITRVIYSTLIAMSDKNVPIDVVTVSNTLRDMGMLDRVGGSSAISELYTFVPIAAHFPYYRKVVMGKWNLRKLIHACSEIIHRCYEHGKDEPDEDVAPLIDFAQETVFNLSGDVTTGDGGQEYAEVIDQVLVDVEKQLNEPAIIPSDRIPFGFCDMDRMIWGAERGQLFILAGRPSMGKSALGKDIYGNVARGEGDYHEWNGDLDPETGLVKWPHWGVKKRVLVINQEMSNKQSVKRDLVGGAGIDLQGARYGLSQRGAQDKLLSRHRQIWNSNIRMYDAPGMSIQRLRSICRSQKRLSGGLDLVVVDYLQLMHSDSKRAQGNRQLEISEISGGLKEMAKECKCVVLALAQLSRSVEERKDKIPIMADLRESGSIEQDADVVMFIHRPWYYHKEGPDDGLAEIHVAKGRDVGLGKIDLTFKGHETRFFSTTHRLLSNNDAERQSGYQSKPQPCKQKEEIQEVEGTQEEFEP
jgi:replicative DNA helicase